MPNYVTTERAAQLLPAAARILVVGCSGGGKTTLARAVGARFDVPYQSLDRDVRWLPGWKERGREDQRRLVAELATAGRWVMDGSGTSTFDLRLPRTDMVLWVRVPRRLALTGLARRVARHYGTERPDMAPGCPEPLPNRDFLSCIWNFERRYVPAMIRAFDQYGPDVPVVILHSRRDMAELIRRAEEGT